MYIITVRSTQPKLDPKEASPEPTTLFLRRTFRLRRVRLLRAGEVETLELQKPGHGIILVRLEFGGSVSWVYIIVINSIPPSFGWAPVGTVRSVKVLDALLIVDYPLTSGLNVVIRINPLVRPDFLKYRSINRIKIGGREAGVVARLVAH